MASGVSEKDKVFNDEHRIDTVLDAFVLELIEVFDENDQIVYANTTELSAYIDPIIYQYEIVNGTRMNV